MKLSRLFPDISGCIIYLQPKRIFRSTFQMDRPLKSAIAVVASIVIVSITASQSVGQEFEKLGQEDRSPARVYPDVLGRQYSAVQRLTTDMGIELKVALKDAPGRKNRVLEQIPPAGTPLGDVDPKMYLVVAKGLVVPNVLGRDVNIVAAELKWRGFSVDVSRRPMEGIRRDQIASIVPHAGKRIDPANEAVFLIASSLSLVRIPADWVGQSVFRIKKEYKGSFNFKNYTPRVSRKFASSAMRPEGITTCYDKVVNDYIVTGSEPPPGALVPPRSDVELYLRRHREVVENGRFCEFVENPNYMPRAPGKGGKVY